MTPDQTTQCTTVFVNVSDSATSPSCCKSSDPICTKSHALCQSFLPALLLVSFAGSSLLISRGPQSIPALLAFWLVLPSTRTVSMFLNGRKYRCKEVRVPCFEIRMSRLQVVCFGLHICSFLRSVVPRTKHVCVTALCKSKQKNNYTLYCTSLYRVRSFLQFCLLANVGATVLIAQTLAPWTSQCIGPRCMSNLNTSSLHTLPIRPGST